MRGSGLSLERFINGKTQRTKAEATTKKRAIIHKAQRKREYAKVKQREGIVTQRGRNPTAQTSVATADEDTASSGPPSFYDRFFQNLKRSNADPNNEVRVRVSVYRATTTRMSDECGGWTGARAAA